MRPIHRLHADPVEPKRTPADRRQRRQLADPASRQPRQGGGRPRQVRAEHLQDEANAQARPAATEEGRKPSATVLYLRVDPAFDSPPGVVVFHRPVFSKSDKLPKNKKDIETQAVESLRAVLEREAPDVARRLGFGKHPRGGDAGRRFVRRAGADRRGDSAQPRCGHGAARQTIARRMRTRRANRPRNRRFISSTPIGKRPAAKFGAGRRIAAPPRQQAGQGSHGVGRAILRRVSQSLLLCGRQSRFGRRASTSSKGFFRDDQPLVEKGADRGGTQRAGPPVEGTRFRHAKRRDVAARLRLVRTGRAARAARQAFRFPALGRPGPRRRGNAFQVRADLSGKARRQTRRRRDQAGKAESAVRHDPRLLPGSSRRPRGIQTDAGEGRGAGACRPGTAGSAGLLPAVAARGGEIAAAQALSAAAEAGAGRGGIAARHLHRGADVAALLLSRSRRARQAAAFIRWRTTRWRGG